MPRFLPFALAILAAAANSAADHTYAPEDFISYNQVGKDLYGVSTDAMFGAVVALSANGTRLAVGSPFHGWSTPYEDPNFQNDKGGGIFLYDYDGSDWNLLWLLHGVEGEEVGDRLSVSADGTRVAVRRYTSSPNFAEVYDITANGVATMVGSPIFSISDGETLTLSPDGSRLALTSESFNSLTGRVEIFEFSSNGDWSNIGFFDGVDAHDRFGWVTAFSKNGDRLAISSPNYDGGLTKRGLVRVFDYDSLTKTWSQVGSDLEGINTNEQFGFSLDMSGDGSTLVVGSPGSVGTGWLRGQVRAFRFTDGQWIQTDSAIEGVDDNDRFGRSVAISNDGSRIAASSYFHGQQRGHSRVFDWTFDTWTQSGPDITGDMPLDRLGYGMFSVSMTEDGKRLASGAMLAEDEDSAINAGQVRVFDELFQPPTNVPSSSPSLRPSPRPSPLKSQIPSNSPSAATPYPTLRPSDAPTFAPSPVPTAVSSDSPSNSPSKKPTPWRFEPTPTYQPIDSIFSEANPPLDSSSAASRVPLASMGLIGLVAILGI